MKRALKTYLLCLALALGGTGLLAQVGGANNQVDCNVYIPNAFTPNADNINDRFLIRVGESCQVLEYKLQVFDRWGRTVYASETLDPNQAWDGSFQGTNLRDGVYMWNLYVKTLSPNTPEATPTVEKQQGTVVLIR